MSHNYKYIFVPPKIVQSGRWQHIWNNTVIINTKMNTCMIRTHIKGRIEYVEKCGYTTWGGIYKHILGNFNYFWEHIGYITWGSLETYPGELWNHEVLNFTNNINMQENEYNKLAKILGSQETKYKMIYQKQYIQWHALCWLIQQYILVYEVILYIIGTVTIINK